MIFTPQNVRDRLREQPFVPVQLVTTTNQTYDIYHPDLVLVGQTFLIVGTPSQNDPTTPDRVTRLALIHLTEMRDLPPVTPPTTNGPAT